MSDAGEANFQYGEPVGEDFSEKVAESIDDGVGYLTME